jgi:hypothetical protein
MKKVLVSGLIIATLAVYTSIFLLDNKAMAAPGPPVKCVVSDTDFFTFPTWSRGLMCADEDGDKKPDGGVVIVKDSSPAALIFTVALNIIDIALRIVAIIAVGFVIYGGFRYLTSQGAPEATKNAQDTILKAVIGMAIAMVSAIIVSFLVGRLNA